MISVVTPAYRNQEVLRDCIASVNAQTSDDWQHVVISDGPDPELRKYMRTAGYRGSGKRVFAELGRNWHGFMGGDSVPTLPGHPGARGGRGSRGAAAAAIGTYLAAGEYVGYCDADCEFLPRHIERTQRELRETGADFVYTQAQRIIDGRLLDIIGTPSSIGHGQVDGNALVHKAELLTKVNWRWGGDSDWDLISRFLALGATFRFIPELTVTWRHASDDI